jgi:uncharacterized protein (TIRG00374 family)
VSAVAHRKWLLGGGLLVSAAFLGIVLWRLDWAVFAAEMRRLHYLPLAATMALIALSIGLRVLRWNLAAGAPLRSLQAFWRAAVIGLAFNQIYPLRAGELVRIFVLRRFAGLPLGQATTSAVVDRLADLLVLGVCALAVVGIHTGVPHAEKAAIATFALACIALLVVIGFGKGGHASRSFVARWSAKAPPYLAGGIERFYDSAMATSAFLASPLVLIRIVALTLVAFVSDCAAFLFATKAFGWELPLIAPLTVLVFLSLGTSLPSGPGYIGVYQVAAVLALALFGVAESAAVAYSIVVQLCVIATVVPLAALAAVGHRDDIRSARSALGKDDP